MKNKISKKLLLSASLSLFLASGFSGCSLKNPFGIGYDSSVCTDSKTFGVCGAPTDVSKYKDKIMKVQNDYLKARIDTTLYFGISPNGYVQVKADRDGKWERYDISEWKKIIDKKIKEKELRIQKESKLAKTMNQEPKVAKNSYVEVDIPVTKNNDLSVAYKKQGPLLVTRTKVGDVIRDQGLIQHVWIANYVDSDNDLVSSHDVYVVVRNPEWIAGEKTPKNVDITSYPTPLSTKLLKKQKTLNNYQSKIVNTYNEDPASARAIIKKDLQKNTDLDIINKYIKSEVK